MPLVLVDQGRHLALDLRDQVVSVQLAVGESHPALVAGAVQKIEELPSVQFISAGRRDFVNELGFGDERVFAGSEVTQHIVELGDVAVEVHVSVGGRAAGHRRGFDGVLDVQPVVSVAVDAGIAHDIKERCQVAVESRKQVPEVGLHLNRVTIQLAGVGEARCDVAAHRDVSPEHQAAVTEDRVRDPLVDTKVARDAARHRTTGVRVVGIINRGDGHADETRVQGADNRIHRRVGVDVAHDEVQSQFALGDLFSEGLGLTKGDAVVVRIVVEQFRGL